MRRSGGGSERRIYAAGRGNWSSSLEAPHPGVDSQMQLRRQVRRVQFQHRPKFAKSGGVFAQAVLAQAHQVPTIDFVAPVEIIVENHELRQRHGEVIDFDVVAKMFSAKIDQRFKTFPRFGELAELLQRQALVKDRFWILIVVINRWRRGFYPRRGISPGLLRPGQIARSLASHTEPK